MESITIPNNSKTRRREDSRNPYAICRLMMGWFLPINHHMGNAVSLTSFLASALASQTTAVEAGIVTLKKSNDVARQQGEAIIQMLEDSLAEVNSRLLDTYA